LVPADANVDFKGAGASTLELGDAAAFTGTIAGFLTGDVLQFDGFAAGSGTQVTYKTNASGTSGTLSSP
jgi:hypothetical protein